MSETPATKLARSWARLGVAFNVLPSAEPPDVERLLLETARQSSENSRAFILAATWLSRFAGRVSMPRLADLIHEELEPDFKPVLGLLLDTAREWAGDERLEKPISACIATAVPRPLFNVEQENPFMRTLVERQASPTARRWGLWVRPFEPKYDSIRPASWIDMMNGGSR